MVIKWADLQKPIGRKVKAMAFMTTAYIWLILVSLNFPPVVTYDVMPMTMAYALYAWTIRLIVAIQVNRRPKRSYCN